MILPRITKLDPRSASLNSKNRALARALDLFHQAAERVPAYKNFLKKMGVNHQLIRTEADFVNVPLTDKPNYFSQYDLAELSWNGTLGKAKYVSSSSGSTGVPFFWPRGDEQDVIVGLLSKRMYDGVFSADARSTLFVNSFSLGTWIAGIEFFNAARWAEEHGSHIAVVTPGIDKVEVVRQIKKLAPLFSQVVLGGYPPFIKDILEHGTECGIDWKKIDLKILSAGEAISEAWKDRVLSLAGRRPGDLSRTISVYGMAEAGIVAHETPVSSLLRRNLKHLAQKIPGLPDADHVTGLYQYYPLARYFEVESSDNLILTANVGLPLIRYSTRDNGGLLGHDIHASKSGNEIETLAKKNGISLGEWKLPFVYLYGRKDLSVSLYALIIYYENVKYALENSKFSSALSGLFTMHVAQKENLDQQFTIAIELAKEVRPAVTMKKFLEVEIAKKITEVNSEYAKLYSVVGDKAKPFVTLVPQGGLQTTPGRKHKWVKKV